VAHTAATLGLTLGGDALNLLEAPINGLLTTAGEGNIVQYMQGIQNQMFAQTFAALANTNPAQQLGADAFNVSMLAFGGADLAMSVAGLARVGLFGSLGSGVDALLNSGNSLTTADAVNHINGLRLGQSLLSAQAQSIFTEAGGLTEKIIGASEEIIPSIDLGDKITAELTANANGDIANWGKYSTQSILSPLGDFKLHFYYNPVINEVYYNTDYKVIFNHQGEWNSVPTPNFEYEPPQFN
jgi:hypothetical protein